MSNKRPCFFYSSIKNVSDINQTLLITHLLHMSMTIEEKKWTRKPFEINVSSCFPELIADFLNSYLEQLFHPLRFAVAAATLGSFT